MTIDEAEAVAKAIDMAAKLDPLGSHPVEQVLARFVLAVMPVVRAAEAWADDGQPICGNSQTEARLGHAILKMRMSLRSE